MDKDKVPCSQCGNEREENPQIPCSTCGSVTRTFHDHVTMSAKAEFQVPKLKHKEIDPQRDINKRRFGRETTTGADYNRDKGIWYIIDQVVDRINNLYKKRLTNPKTGEIVLDIAKPLTDHTGHGAAKKKNTNIENEG
jgi:hypothetical protein